MTMTPRCESISKLDNVRCDRPAWHDGDHVSEWDSENHSSRAIWSGVMQQCDSISPMELQRPARCERPKNHKGAHFAILGPNNIATWDEVQFKLNFIEDGDKK